MAWWELNRDKQKKLVRQWFVGLPIGLIFVIPIIINLSSGWYKRADNILQSNSSLILVLLVAALLIVAFVVIFSIHHKWDMNEQRYNELISRKDQPEKL